MSEQETSHSISGVMPEPPHFLRGMAGVIIVLALLIASVFAVFRYLI
jgi:hypothetical protein